MILVDSSVWIDFWNRGQSDFAVTLAALIEENQVAINGFIYCELLKGARNSKERRFMMESFSTLFWLEFDDSDFRLSEELSWQLKQKGVNVTLVDACIAHQAVKSKAELYSKDKVFKHISKHSSLELFSV